VKSFALISGIPLDFLNTISFTKYSMVSTSVSSQPLVHGRKTFLLSLPFDFDQRSPLSTLTPAPFIFVLIFLHTHTYTDACGLHDKNVLHFIHNIIMNDALTMLISCAWLRCGIGLTAVQMFNIYYIVSCGIEQRSSAFSKSIYELINTYIVLVSTLVILACWEYYNFNCR